MVLLNELQELKSSGGVMYSVQTTLPEAGGQVWVVPVSVFWGLRPGAPRGGVVCGEVGVPAQGRLCCGGRRM